MSSLKLKNFHLEYLLGSPEQKNAEGVILVPKREGWLNVKLSGRQARLRGKFLKVVQQKYQEREEARMEIVKSHAELDEAGNPKIVVDENGSQKYDMSPEKMADVNKEYIALLNEDCVIDVPESMQETMSEMKSYFADPIWDVDGNDSAILDSICEAFDKVE